MGVKCHQVGHGSGSSQPKLSIFVHRWIDYVGLQSGQSRSILLVLSMGPELTTITIFRCNVDENYLILTFPKLSPHGVFYKQKPMWKLKWALMWAVLKRR